jgi:hypothetical protein
MTDETTRIEGQILAYESRQKQIDELFERAHEHAGDAPEHGESRTQLNRLAEQHGHRKVALDRLKARAPSEWSADEIDQVGPMAVWDTLAAELETLIERFTKH